MTPVEKFRLVASVALVDGNLGQPEQQVLLKAAERLGLSTGEATGIVQELMQGGQGGSAQAPASSAERRQLFGLLIDVAAADGVVTPQELGVLQHLAGAFNLRPGDVPAMLQKSMARQGVGGGGAPPPMPAGGAAVGAPAQNKTGEAGCPSCGAPIEFRNTRSVAATCEYCDTTVTRKDGSKVLKDLGKISQLVADASPIQIGARGEAFGSGFEVLGRLQLEHRTGTWNEWYIEWKDGRTGWLGEAQGQYFVTLPDGEMHPDEKLPEFNSIGVGQRIFVGRKRYQVAEVRMAKATGGEGELPFIVGAGYELPYADLRRPDNGFATIDYSESPPLVFTGRCVGWKQLNLTNHREFDGWRV